MKKFIIIITLAIVSLCIGASYGYFVHRNKIFPYANINKAFMRNLYKREMNWTIGVYEGITPFKLIESTDVKNPVLSARDVDDIDAAFVADPFMVEKNGKYFMFFEVMNLETNSGDIGYAVSDDGKKWEYEKIILDETFHLSYPGIYEWDGDYYMIPESAEDLSVRLYKAKSFPDKWEYIGNLLSGDGYCDPTAFYYESKWWMFTSNTGNDVLNLYYSDSLTLGWQDHPMNPLIENNKHIARPAGRVFEFENRIFRLAQDDSPTYGVQVFAVEIIELSCTEYRENSDSASIIVKLSGKGWNSEGMHHVDLHQGEGNWYSAVDGVKRR